MHASFTNKIKILSRQNNGMIKRVQLDEAQIPYAVIYKLLKDKILVKIRTGFYMLKSEADTLNEPEMLSKLFPKAVVCMYSALFHYGYSDRIPECWDIAVDKNTNKSSFKTDFLKVHPYYIRKEHLQYGISEEKYDGSTWLKTFDRDRLICECLIYENKLDKEIFNKAIQAYLSDENKNIHNLLRYASKRRTMKKVRNYIEIWL